MSGARRIVERSIALATALALVLGCAGPDAGNVTFSGGAGGTAEDADESSAPDRGDSSSSGDGGASGGASGEGGTGGGGVAATVNPVFVSDAYPAIAPPCGSCHLSGSGNAPVFFGRDAAASYPLFKQRSYHKPNSGFVSKGAHKGPPLTASQRAAVDKWVAAEGG